MFKEKDQSWPSFFLEMVIIISVVLFIRFYVFQFFRVHGVSMCPTLNFVEDKCRDGKGEFIFVNEFLYHFRRDPQRGEIVVFRPPIGEKHYIKRVIGVPGDTIDVRHGKVFLSNDEYHQQLLDEPYLSLKNRGRTLSQRETFEVPEGHYVLFGDNRQKSLDSRYCFSACDGRATPFVPKKNIRGRSEFVIWPLDRLRWLTEELFEENEEESSAIEGS